MSIPRRARRLMPQLAEAMREDRQFWAGDSVSDRAYAQFLAVGAVLAAVTGPEATPPSGCWGYDMKTKRCRCELHRALDNLRALTAKRRRAPTPTKSKEDHRG